MANKPEIKKRKKKERKNAWWKRRGKEKNKTTTLSEKKEEASNVSEQRDKGWIHVICVHNTTHLAVTTWQGNTHKLPHTKKE